MRRFLQDQGRTSKPQMWEVHTTGNLVHVTWGQLGGSLQTTTEECEPVNVGKKNEKSAIVVAEERLERLVLGKTRQGYYEVNPSTNEPLKERNATGIDFIRLPESLRFFKPQNNVNAHVQKLMDQGRAIWLRKRDGMMHIVSVGDDGEPRLYSSQMLPTHKDEPEIPWMDRYPHLRQELLMLDLPPNTILLGEICPTVSSGERFVDDLGLAKDDFQYVGSVIKSLTPRSLTVQKENGYLGFCIWDIAFWDGDCWLQTVKARDRFNHLRDLFPGDEHRWVTMPEIIMVDANGDMGLYSVEGEDLEIDDDGKYERTAANFAKTQEWEGYVVVDPESVYEDRAYNFHGKPERPKTAVKLKPKFEADFIVRWDPENGVGRKGKGKKSKGVGSVMAYLWDPEKQEEREICLIGGGLSDANVKAFADPSLYPMIWQCEFAEWTAKGALRFPEFVRVRDDKNLEDCTVDQNPAWRSDG